MDKKITDEARLNSILASAGVEALKGGAPVPVKRGRKPKADQPKLQGAA